jgi:hypothetical protein
MSERLFLPCAVILAALAGSCAAGEIELPAKLLLATTNAVSARDAERLNPSGETHLTALPGLVAVFGISNSLPVAVVFIKHDRMPVHGYVEVPEGMGWHTRFGSFGAPYEISRFTLQPFSNYCFSVFVPTDSVWRAACYGQIGTNTVVFRSRVFSVPNPQGGADGRQPVGSETDRASGPAAARRSP